MGVEPLITGLDFEALIGDKAFDNNWLRANLNERGAPSKARGHPSRCRNVQMAPPGRELLLRSQGIPPYRNSRYEKTDACFAGLLNLVATFLAIR